MIDLFCSLKMFVYKESDRAAPFLLLSRDLEPHWDKKHHIY